MDNAKIFSGTSHPKLAQDIASKLNVKLGKIAIDTFPDGECHVQIEESIRGKVIYLIQPLSFPVNENIIELLVMIDACKRASAKSINAVIPYFAYGRQNKKSTGREPISSKLLTNLLNTAGVDRIISVDLHKPQIQGFFDKPFDHLSAFTIISEYLKSKDIKNPVVVAPDTGKAPLAIKYASMLDCPMIIMYKKKLKGGKVISGGIIGDPKDKTPIIVDDMMANGTAMVQAEALLEKGCRPEIYFGISHPILLDTALKKLSHPAVKEVVVTDTIPVYYKKEILPKITILSIADLLSDVIYRVYHNKSVSEVFHKKQIDFPV